MPSFLLSPPGALFYGFAYVENQTHCRDSLQRKKCNIYLARYHWQRRQRLSPMEGRAAQRFRACFLCMAGRRRLLCALGSSGAEF